MPIEFSNRKPVNLGKPPRSPEFSEPSISFSMTHGRSQSPPASSVGWVWALLIVWPFFGFIVGLFMLQEAKHAKARGNPWSGTRTTVIMLPTVLSFFLTVGIGLYLVAV